MRLKILCAVALLASRPVAAGQLPVSLGRIREALKHPVESLRGLDETPCFQVEVQEKQKFDSGPVPPVGLYAYEQFRSVFPTSQYPQLQPYGAFNQTELLQVSVTSFLEKFFAMHASAGRVKQVRR